MAHESTTPQARPFTHPPTRLCWWVKGPLSRPRFDAALEALAGDAGAASISRAWLDAAHLPEADRAAECAAVAARDAQLLSADGDALRVSVLRLADDEHALVITRRLPVSTRATVEPVLDALLAHYAGDPAPRVDLSATASDHWHPGGGAEALDLPTDRPRPAVRTFRAGTVVRPVELPGLPERVEDLTAHLLAGTALTLSRYSGQRSVAVAVALPECREVRVECDDRGDYRGLVEQVAAQLAGRARTADPAACSVLFAVEREPAPRLVAGLRVRPVDLDPTWIAHDFHVDVLARSDGLVLRVDHDLDIFDRRSAERLADRLTAVWRAAADNPPLAGLTPITPAERDLVLSAWSGGPVPEPDPRCLHDLLGAHRTDAPAVVCGPDRITHRELHARANRAAHRLRALGVGPETVVAVTAQRSTAAVVGFLAVLKAGGAYLPVDPAQPAERLARLLANAALVLGPADVVRGLGAPAVALEDTAGEPDTDPEPRARPHHLAYVIHTSGSSGEPKGVAVTHQAVVRSTLARDHQGPPPGVDLLTPPLSFDGANGGLYWTLAHGGTVVLPTPDQLRNPVALARLLAEHRVTHVHTTPGQYGVLLEAATPDQLAGLAHVAVGGEPLPPTLVAAHRAACPGALLANDYGPTEATVWATSHVCTAADGAGRAVPVGRPLPGYRVHVLDDALRPVPPGVPGDLYIGGACLARGYLGRPARTAEVFVPDPYAAEPGVRLYRTGDRARHRDDGTLELLGRVDDQVKIRGYRVELGEVENTLLRHPAVREAAVVPAGDRLRAFVTATAPTSPYEVQNWLADRLPDYMCPDSVEVLPALPLTPNGKVDTAALRRDAPAPRRSGSLDDLTPEQVDRLLGELLR